MAKYAKAHGILFDLDGLLLDTESLYTEITQGIVSRYGKVFDWSVKGNMIGRPDIDSARYLVEALDLPITAEDYLDERNDLLQDAFSKAEALPGAQRLIRHCHKHKVPIAVATSSKRAMFDIKTQLHRSWFDLFQVVIAGDHPDIKNGKPAPDIFLIASAALGIDPQDALVFEDSPSGLEAGVAAGCRVIAVPDPNMDQSRYAKAHAVLPSLDAFLPEEYGLPPHS